jgi:hypothetical protein
MAVIVDRKTSRAVVVDRSRTSAIVRNRPSTVQVDDRRTVRTVERQTATVGVSSQGVQGRPGTPGGSAETRIAANTLGGHRIVRSVDASAVGYADCTDTTHGDDTLGMTTGAALEGESVEVQRVGAISFNGWAWTPGEPVFLSTSGAVTQTAPEEGAAFVQVIGHAESATSIQLHIEPPTYY